LIMKGTINCIRSKRKSQMKPSLFSTHMRTGLFLILIILGCEVNKSGNGFDVVVYGGTPGGVIAAVAAARNGAEVLLIEQTQHVGGLSTSGINTGESEHMINKAITGFAREFYVRLGEKFPEGYYETFPHGIKENFQKGDPAFFFESHVAEEVFNNMLAEAGVEVVFERFVESVNKEGPAIREMVLDNDEVVKGRVFIDASYEGDLMSRSGVSYTWGRESRGEYGESYAGIRFIDDTLRANTVDSDGELLPYFSKNEGLVPGSGDNRVMNYNFRLAMTKVPDNKVAVEKPQNYDPSQFELLADFLSKYPDTKLGQLFGIYDRGSGKFEYNNKQQAVISLGLFGGNVDYPDADYARRKEIYQAHKDYTLGLLYFLGHDPSVPESLKEEMLSYGFCRDEFVDNNHFPYYLYIREARRMIGDFVMTQLDILENRTKKDAITLGSHWIDSHHVQRVAISDSTFTNEGRIWHTVTQPFELPYSILLSKEEECNNLLVPVCASLSHVAFCSYRLESTWMQMGHATGTAAALCSNQNIAVHEVDIRSLQDKLRKEGMLLKTSNLGEYDDYVK